MLNILFSGHRVPRTPPRRRQPPCPTRNFRRPLNIVASNRLHRIPTQHRLKKTRTGPLPKVDVKMPAAKNNAQPQLLFVDGSFDELAREMADYLKSEDAKQLLSGDKEPSKEDVLAKLVAASQALNTVSEKEFTAASNLMIHLVLQSADPKKYLPTLCANFAKPIVNSPVHGAGLSLNALTTVFNLLDAEDPIRARVFMQILKFLKANAMFDNLRPYLDKLPEWLDTWETGEEFDRQVYEAVAEVALEAGEEK